MSRAAGKIDLPLLNPVAAATPLRWQEWEVASALPEVIEAPEPLVPQGMYGPGEQAVVQWLPAEGVPARKAELLAPAGGPDAAYAALHFGADAVYLGLKKFSARAEAENFTLQELEEITAYAHSLEPRRRVFVTVNTVLRQDELPELVEALDHLSTIGVDAVILQDLGVYHLVRQYYPHLEAHASTQLAVHNRAGAEVLRQMGFQRVVLARELTFEEVRDITATAGIETEVFIHGALCYSYSGLCLFSAQTLGRSGNRGKCAYSCRDSFQVEGAPLTLRDGSTVKRDPRTGFPFSMKDLALPDHLPALQAAGVSCFKVEGRKKSPLYVATTTAYYRRLLDGQMQADERPALEADLQTVFSRPWTQLFVHSHKDKEVADRDTVGHRGTPIGQVEAVLNAHTAEPRLRFRTERTLERHDGLQIDLPVLGKPFGFAVEHLWIVDPKRNRKAEGFSAPAGSLVEVSLPREHPPLPKNAPVYCSSSQAVKQKYRYARPKPGQYRLRLPLRVNMSLTPEQVALTVGVVGREIEVHHTLAGSFQPARNPNAMAEAVRSTFEKLGATGFTLADLQFHNPENLFVPVSKLNELRRELMAQLAAQVQQAQAERIRRIQAEVCPAAAHPSPEAPSAPFQWTLKVDRINFLDALEETDYQDVEEIIIDIARDHPTVLAEKLQHWAARVGKEKIRLALPPLTRAWEEKGIWHKLRHLRPEWHKWEVANLSGWHYLGLDPLRPERIALDLSTDWSLYVVNRLAARQVLQMGACRFTLSPEDGLGNVRSLLTEFAQEAVLIVHQDTPMFVAESCAYANLIGGCPGKANCSFESMEMVSSFGEKVTALDYHCRTIVLNQGPFCLSTRMPDLAAAGAQHLRADFIYRKYTPEEVRRVWRLLRTGKPVPGGHAANFDRGLL
jgi:putative protease